MKITEYPKTKTIEKSDILLLDGEDGTRTIKAEDLSLQLDEINSDPSWVAHKNIYRGKNLGTVFTEEQKAQIANNTFDDMYIGDYWVINGHNWTIADINYWNIYGNTALSESFKTPHLNIIPSGGGNILVSKMYDTKTTANGYNGSKVKNEIMPQSISIFKNDFGESHIITHNDFISDAITNNKISGNHIETDIEGILMTEDMVFGSSSRSLTHSYNYNHVQLALFRLNPWRIGSIVKNEGCFNYWLKEPINDIYWGVVDKYRCFCEAYPDQNYAIIPIFGLQG